MSLTGAGVAGVFGGPWLGAAAAAEAEDADLVVFNAKVYTVDPRAPKAEASVRPDPLRSGPDPAHAQAKGLPNAIYFSQEPARRR
jgi:hypothetical protein